MQNGSPLKPWGLPILIRHEMEKLIHVVTIARTASARGALPYGIHNCIRRAEPTTIDALLSRKPPPFALTIFEAQPTAGDGTPCRSGWNDPAMQTKHCGGLAEPVPIRMR